MKTKAYNAIIISISSDIGVALAKRWLTRGWRVIGTYRTENEATKKLSESNINLIKCDLFDDKSVTKACKILQEVGAQWDCLVLCAGNLNPVGFFEETEFDKWAGSININFTNQLRILHALLPDRNKSNTLGPCVLFFAGGGTNNATVNYSAYTISKIALIKMCELLDAEIKDTRFTILGPGWVKTKIHESTMEAGAKAGNNLKRTIDKFTHDEFTPMQEVLDCCDWLIQSPRKLISGRNFSVVFDAWGTNELSDKLVEEPDMYKLRRHGNNWIIRR